MRMNGDWMNFGTDRIAVHMFGPIKVVTDLAAMKLLLQIMLMHGMVLLLLMIVTRKRECMSWYKI